MSDPEYRRFLLNLAEFSQPTAKRRALLQNTPLQEVRQLFHRFSFGSVAIKTDSEQPLERLLECACEELRSNDYRVA